MGKEILANGEYYYGAFKMSKGYRFGKGRCYHTEGDITYCGTWDKKAGGYG